MAVWPPDDVLDAIAALPRPTTPRVRWTSRDQWHVTLRFMGDADVEAVVRALASVKAGRCDAVLGPNVKRLGRGVLCVPVVGLEDLAEAVVAATADLGRPPDHRSFRGHVTLARMDGRARPRIDSVISHRWPVATFALVRSHLGGGPARYETVAMWPLRP